MAGGFPQSKSSKRESKAIQRAQDGLSILNQDSPRYTVELMAFVKEENTWEVSMGSSAQTCSQQLQSIKKNLYTQYQNQTALRKKAILVSQVTSGFSSAENDWAALCVWLF